MRFEGVRRERISPFFKILFIIIVNLSVFILLYYYLISPQKTQIEKLTKEYERLNSEWMKLNLSKNKMGNLRSEYEELKSKLLELFNQLPESKDVPNLFRKINRLATESKLKIQYFESKDLILKDFYAELPFELRYTGSYHNILYFFEGLGRMERIVKIEDFLLEAKGTPPHISLEGLCNAKTFVYQRVPEKTKKESKGATKK